jgi:hypothetical protein
MGGLRQPRRRVPSGRANLSKPSSRIGPCRPAREYKSEMPSPLLPHFAFRASSGLRDQWACHCGCHSRAGRPSPSPSWQSGVSLSVRWLLTLAFDHLSPHRIWLASVDAMPIKDHRIPMSASAICSKTTSRRASAPCASSLVCRACSRAWFTCWGRSCAISQSP